MPSNREMPEFEIFPDGDTRIPDVSVNVVANGVGILTSQDGDHLHHINLDTFVGPTPADGAIRVSCDAESARLIARHLLKLADYAELGVEAPRDE